MATIIDNTYFVGETKLPQTSNPFQLPDVDRSISIYEPEILKKLLGYQLYTALQTAWDASKATPTPTPLPDRFDKLINGAEFSFEFNGFTVTQKWGGLANTEKISLISYYVHYKFLNINEGRITNTGQSKTKKENAETISVRPMLIHSWNQMVYNYGTTPKPYHLPPVSNIHYRGTTVRNGNFRWTERNVNQYFLDQNNYDHYDMAASAYNYLLANISDFPEWIFEPVYKINLYNF